MPARSSGASASFLLRADSRGEAWGTKMISAALRGQEAVLQFGKVPVKTEFDSEISLA